LGEGGSLRDSCVKALQTVYSSLKSRGGEGGSLAPVVSGDALLDLQLIVDDVGEVTGIMCREDSVVLRSDFVGALSKARSIGVEAYSALLRVALESNSSVGSSGFSVSDGVLSFIYVIRYSDVEKSPVKGKSPAEIMKLVVESLILVKSLVSGWLARTLAMLEKGEQPKPFNLERELRHARGYDVERAYSGDTLYR